MKLTENHNHIEPLYLTSLPVAGPSEIFFSFVVSMLTLRRAVISPFRPAGDDGPSQCFEDVVTALRICRSNDNCIRHLIVRNKITVGKLFLKLDIDKFIVDDSY